MAKKNTQQAKTTTASGHRKDPLSKGRIVAFAVAAVLAFLLPVLLGGAVLIADWTGSLAVGGNDSNTAVVGEPLVAGVTEGCAQEAARREEAAQEEYLQAAASEEQKETEDPCQAVLDMLPKAEDTIVYLGGYRPSKDVKNALEDCVKLTREQKHAVGFVMLDLKTGKGVAYNTAQEFYGASSIKVHRILAIAESHPELIKDYEWAVRNVLVESDNYDYEWLSEIYGNSAFDKYISDARASIRYSEGAQYAYYSTASFARMWKHAYDLMQSMPDCDAAGALAEMPYDSSIHRLLGRSYTTRSKAGWIYESGVSAAADGGIVYDKESPYLLVIMSDYASDLTMLDPYVQALEQAHRESKEKVH